MTSISIVICGLGSAGKSRLKAVQESPHFQLKGIVSRRHELATCSWEDVLRNPEISAIAVSTENTDHFKRTFEALQAGKHVLCDYPLCFSTDELEQLQAARKPDQVLHIEHLSLLGKDHVEMKERLTAGSLKSGEYLFTGGLNPKWLNKDFAGPIIYMAYARVMQLADWFGPFHIAGHSITAREDQLSIKLKLVFKNGGEVDFEERRAAHLPRQRRALFRMTSGELPFGVEETPKGLFKADLHYFGGMIREGKNPYYRWEAVNNITREFEKTP